jgi:hypothetical protein
MFTSRIEWGLIKEGEMIVEAKFEVVFDCFVDWAFSFGCYGG